MYQTGKGWVCTYAERCNCIMILPLNYPKTLCFSRSLNIDLGRGVEVKQTPIPQRSAKTIQQF